MIYLLYFVGWEKLLIFYAVYHNKWIYWISSGDSCSDLECLICLHNLYPLMVCTSCPSPAVLPLHIPLIRRKMRNCASLFNSMRISLQTSLHSMKLTLRKLNPLGNLERRRWLSSVRRSYRRRWMDCRRSGTRNAE